LIILIIFGGVEIMEPEIKSEINPLHCRGSSSSNSSLFNDAFSASQTI
jgi:hypothetical protein